MHVHNDLQYPTHTAEVRRERKMYHYHQFKSTKNTIYQGRYTYGSSNWTAHILLRHSVIFARLASLANMHYISLHHTQHLGKRGRSGYKSSRMYHISKKPIERITNKDLLSNPCLTTKFRKTRKRLWACLQMKPTNTSRALHNMSKLETKKFLSARFYRHMVVS